MEYTDVEKYFEEKKGITVDSARNAGARYTAIDICRFAKKYHESEVKKSNMNDDAKECLDALSHWDEKEFKDALYENHKLKGMRPMIITKKLLNKIINFK